MFIYAGNVVVDVPSHEARSNGSLRCLVSGHWWYGGEKWYTADLDRSAADWSPAWGATGLSATNIKAIRRDHTALMNHMVRNSVLMMPVSDSWLWGRITSKSELSTIGQRLMNKLRVEPTMMVAAAPLMVEDPARTGSPGRSTVVAYVKSADGCLRVHQTLSA